MMQHNQHPARTQDTSSGNIACSKSRSARGLGRLHPRGDTTSARCWQVGIERQGKESARERKQHLQKQKGGVLCWDIEYANGWSPGGHIDESKLGNVMRGSVAQFSSMSFTLKELRSSVQV